MKHSLQILLQELENPKTTHRRRLEIGELLAEMGDPRRGVGVKEGLPDIYWCAVTLGGRVTVTRVWEPETPDDEARVTHRQSFDVKPFYIAKYLVTYAQFEAFVQAADGYNNLTWWQGMPEAYQPQELAEQHLKQTNNPRDSLSWYQCIAFARWMNHKLQGYELSHPSGEGVFRVGDNAQIRLLAEWEWQWAAQNGDEARRYPWGEQKGGHANTAESGLRQTTAVGMYPHGAAACGAMDMTGNLMEWCANDKQDMEVIDVSSHASKALRGGDWGYGLEIATCARADDEIPERMDVLNGCRLVLTQVL